MIEVKVIGNLVFIQDVCIINLASVASIYKWRNATNRTEHRLKVKGSTGSEALSWGPYTDEEVRSIISQIKTQLEARQPQSPPLPENEVEDLIL